MPKSSTSVRDWTRALLTETLPYETPLFFSNEKLRSLLHTNELLDGLPYIAKHLLIHSKPAEPYAFTVHKGGGGRRPLSVPHPAGQINIAKFYAQFDGFIQNLCSRSGYSLRYPSRVASRYFQSQFARKDDPDDQEVDADPSSFVSQRDWASSYFSYRPYTQMHLFFASSEYISLEQTYEFMMRLDVAKCFESIYTHSIAWAVRGKDFTKENINATSFEGEFDRLMRSINWGETNGIVIGPEVSRIFAEIVLQAVDRQIEYVVAPLGVTVRRYVDDYLIFGHSEKELSLAREAVESALRLHNLHLNEKKTAIFRRPLVSQLSIARLSGIKLVADFFDRARGALNPVNASHFARDAGAISIDQFRHVAKQFDVEYASLASPLLATIVNSLSRLRKRLPTIGEGQASPKYATRIIAESVRLALFVYVTDVRVATTQKFARILYETSLLASKLRVDNLALEGRYIDAMRTVLDAASHKGIAGPEIVNLLLAVDSVCRQAKAVGPDDLRRAVGAAHSWREAAPLLDYFSLISILYVSRKRGNFAEAKETAISEIERRVLSSGRRLREKTSETMLFFDFLSCPHISRARRTDLLRAVVLSTTGSTVSNATAALQFAILEKRVGFVHWDGRAGTRSLRRLLQKKELQPAYE